MRAVKRRPLQAVSRLPPSPYNEHPTSARNRECGPVTATTMTPEVKVSVRSAGEVLVRLGHSRAVLPAIDALELAGRLEIAAEVAERRSAQ